jgi:hypothetical protein
MANELDEKEKLMKERIKGMSDEEMADFLTELYFRASGAIMLVEFLEKKGVIDSKEYKGYVIEQLRKL